MAIKRIIPEQDTFIVSSSIDSNYGADEILELGMTDCGTKPARILIKFSTEQVRSILNTVPENFRAVLHLNLVDAHNLPTVSSILLNTIPQQWSEGIGRIGDYSVEGATWEYTGLFDSGGNDIPWETPGGTVFRVFDGEYAIQGPILNVLDGEGSVVQSIHTQANGGGARTWEVEGAEGIIRFFGQEIYDRDLRTDVEIDITAAVRSWRTGDNAGMLLRFGNERECEFYGANISFYSKETHTVYRPYLEFRWDDSVYEPEGLSVCPDVYGTFSNNLRREYTVGDLVRINLPIKSRYASRNWSTGSIYANNYVLPETSYWGIKNEYTNEMEVDFNEYCTKISADSSGSYFMLDTSNLEPERYYRLLVKIDQGEGSVVVDNKNIFRLGRNGWRE